ncbi:PaaI family thioesterase [Priestia megaterium]|uniref:PaaI family thioesterase n=1 Tax=Priestia megaterium TaxID=1404 RepID=UPI00215ABF42|nr:PaaI family thioesterase [Priestia megaterium]MCR8864227.1 PaaI family thioesterase [Priestia megaterium]
MKRTSKGMIPFWDYIGIEEKLLERGYAELKITIQPQLLQGRGTVHGGVIATLIDAAVGSAVRSSLSEDESASTVELKYTRPGIGDYLVAKSTLSHRGKTLAVGEVKIEDSSGKLVALGSATYMIFSVEKA